MKSPSPPDPDDTPMTGRYVAAIVIEVVIIALLWLIGRIYT